MNKIFKLFKIKKYFFLPPKKTSLIIYDRTNSNIFFPYLKNIKFGICDTRLESINIFILVIAIVKYNFKFKFFYYFVEYLKYTKCKTIITFVDNNINFYKIKNHIKNICTISIQNGLRPTLFFNELEKENKLSVDYFFAFNNYFIDKFKKNIKGNFVNSGSFKSNEVNISKYKNNDLIYISSGPETLEKKIRIFKNIKVDPQKYFYPETILVKII